ncbi:Protein delta 1 [Sparganum proliferum]
MALGEIQPKKTFSKERGIFLLGFMYRNERHESSSGPCDNSGGDLWCDPFFHICVNDDKRPGPCNLLDHTTEDVKNRDNVFFTDEKAFKIPLTDSIPRRISVRIEATDFDKFTPHDHIATFENPSVDVAPANVTAGLQLKNKEVNMNNRRVIITGTLKLMCTPGYLGEFCDRLCFAGIHPTVVGCNPDGTFICQNDFDKFTPHDHIATFENPSVDVAPANVTAGLQLKNKEVNMNNRRVIITGTLKLMCTPGYLGEFCDRLCFAGIHPTVVGCNPDGTFICQNGTRGENCEKIDACFHPLCVPGAVCRNLDYGKYYECVCNGHSGPECEASYNPCESNPCQNNGVCTPLGADFRCDCPRGWKGRQCNTPLSPCESAEQNLTGALILRSNSSTVVVITAAGGLSPVCNNKGICEDDKYKYKCHCITGWTGERCEERDTSNLLIIGVIGFGIMLIILLALIPCLLRMREKRKKSFDDENGFVYQYSSPSTLAAYNSPALSSVYFTQPRYPSELPAVGNINEYEYCNSVYNNSIGGDVRTFMPTGTLETTNESHASPTAAPPLPERPTTLLPLSPAGTVYRSHNLSSARARVTSTNSVQPLLTSSSVEDDVLILPRRSSTEARTSTSWFSSLRR